MRGKCTQITLVSFTQNSHLFAGRKLGSEWILWHQNFQILELSSWAHKRQRLFFFFSASHCCASSCWLFILDYLFIKFIIISQRHVHIEKTLHHLTIICIFYFVLILNLNFIFLSLLLALLLCCCCWDCGRTRQLNRRVLRWENEWELAARCKMNFLFCIRIPQIKISLPHLPLFFIFYFVWVFRRERENEA